MRQEGESGGGNGTIEWRKTRWHGRESCYKKRLEVMRIGTRKISPKRIGKGKGRNGLCVTYGKFR